MKGYTKNGKFHPIRNKRSPSKSRRKINVGDNPQHTPKLNKFIAKSGDGLRGKLLARTTNGKRGIILAQNSSFDGDVKWGKLYEVVERKPTEYPVVKKEVMKIPDTKDWELL